MRKRRCRTGPKRIQRRVYIVFAPGQNVADVYLTTNATKASNENMCWMQEASLANLFLSARPIVRPNSVCALRYGDSLARSARFFASASSYCRRVLVTGSKHEFLIAEMGPGRCSMIVIWRLPPCPDNRGCFEQSRQITQYRDLFSDNVPREARIVLLG